MCKYDQKTSSYKLLSSSSTRLHSGWSVKFVFLNEVVLNPYKLSVSFCQAKKTGGDHGSREAEHAENLLLANKPFTELTPQLTQLVSTSKKFTTHTKHT